MHTGDATDRLRCKLRGDDCVYCGEMATSGDHYPPIAAVGPRGAGLILPACVECNMLIGDRYPFSFSARADYLKSRLRQKLAKYLNHVEWSDDELEAVSAKLRKEFLGWRKMKARAYERIAWNVAAALANIVQTNDFALLRANLGFTPENEPPWFTLLESE